MSEFLDYCATADVLGLDTETNGEPIRDGRGYCQGVSLAIPGSDGKGLYHYLPLRHRVGNNLPPSYVSKLQDVLEFRAKNSLPHTCHNLLFDMPSLSTLGIDISTSFGYCTLIGAQLVDEVEPYEKSLDNCVKHYCGPSVASKKTDGFFEVWVKKFGWANVPSEMMYEYGSWDAELHRRLYWALQKKWNAENLEAYWRNHKLPTLQVWNTMMNRGVRIDVDLCERMSAIGHGMMDEIRETLNLNPGSTKDLKTLLIDNLGLPVVKWTDGGKSKIPKPSFDKYAMEIYDKILERTNDPTGRMVLEYRGWQKSVSSNYEPYVRLLSPDGRLRPNYKLHGTKTLRSSCEDPNLQQIPKVSTKPWNGRMKKCFIPMEGFSLLEGDEAQLELRFGTSYGKDPELLAIFEDDSRDIFDEMSERLGYPRQDIKLWTYSTGYGAGDEKVAMILGISEAESAKIRALHRASYPGINNVSAVAMQTAKVKKRIKIWSGRYKHFTHWEEKPHKAFNAAIQGGAADIVEGVMRNLYNELDNEDECRMLLQVHDSVVFEVRSDLRHIYEPEIKRVMERIEPDFGVRFKADVHAWGE